MGNFFSNPIRGPSSCPVTLSLTQFLQKFQICLGSGYREIGPFQPMHVDRGLLNCPTSPSHEKQTKSDQAKISLCQSQDWFHYLFSFGFSQVRPDPGRPESPSGSIDQVLNMVLKTQKILRG